MSYKVFIAEDNPYWLGLHTKVLEETVRHYKKNTLSMLESVINTRNGSLPTTEREAIKKRMSYLEEAHVRRYEPPKVVTNFQDSEKYGVGFDLYLVDGQLPPDGQLQNGSPKQPQNNGLRIMRHLHQKGVEYGKIILISSNENITSAALKAGFTNVVHKSRAHIEIGEKNYRDLYGLIAVALKIDIIPGKIEKSA